MPRSTSAASSPPFFHTCPSWTLTGSGRALKADDAPSMQSALQGAVQPAMQNGDVCNAEREKESKREGGGSRRSPSRPCSPCRCGRMSSRAIAPVVGASFKTVARDIESVSTDTDAPRTVKSIDGVERTFGRHLDKFLSRTTPPPRRLAPAPSWAAPFPTSAPGLEQRGPGTRGEFPHASPSVQSGQSDHFST